MEDDHQSAARHRMAHNYALADFYRGDERLFADIALAYAPTLHNYVEKFIGKRDRVPLAEDITQETLLKL